MFYVPDIKNKPTDILCHWHTIKKKPTDILCHWHKNKLTDILYPGIQKSPQTFYATGIHKKNPKDILCHWHKKIKRQTFYVTGI